MIVKTEPGLPPVSLRFVADLPLYESQKPYEIWLEDLPPGIEKTNVRWDEHHNIPVRSMRSHHSSLETTGFTYIHHRSQHLPEFVTYSKNGEDFSTFTEGKGIEPYLHETTNLVKEIMGAEKTFIQDWRVSSDVPS
jgi:hypothetical protein